jgi:hypothetical protein
MMNGKPSMRVAVSAPTGGAAFDSYAAGKRHYGSGRNAPNVGKSVGMAGYGKRDAEASNRVSALQRRLQGGKF